MIIGDDDTIVAHTGTAITIRVGVDTFQPTPRAWQADAIPLAYDRREVADHDELVAVEFSSSSQSIHSKPAGSQSVACRLGWPR